MSFLQAKNIILPSLQKNRAMINETKSWFFEKNKQD
jgi:hypothetical protein